MKKWTPTIAGVSQEIYRAVTNRPQGQVYRVHFSRVGSGNGDYVRQGRTTNGIVYVFRGSGLGDYVPERMLPRPIQQHMVDLRGAFSPIQQMELFGEWAHSLYDRNRFSSLDAGDNLGQAYTGGVRLKDMSVGLGTASATISRRLTGLNFATFARITPVEFARRWNLPVSRSTIQNARALVDEGMVAWQLTERSQATGTLGRFELGDHFNATRQEFKMQVSEEYLPHLSYQVHYSSNQADSVQGTWLRQKGSVEQSFLAGQLVPAITIGHDRRHNRIEGRFIRGSRSYVQLSPEISWGSTLGELGLTLDWRVVDSLGDGILQPASDAKTFGFRFDLRPSRIWFTEGRLGWRTRSYSEFFRTTGGLADEQSLVIRWTGRVRPWRQALQVNWFYEALSERAPILQEIYIRTGPELGEYVWVDANGNDVIEIDEFIPETTQDEGIYARTLIPSDSLQSAIGLQARMSLTVDPNRVWRSTTTQWKQWLRNVVLRTSVHIQEKSRTPDLADIYLLRLGRFRDDEYTLKGLLSLGQDIWLFRGNSRFGAEGSWRKVRSLSALAASSESRAADTWRLQLRWKPWIAWGFRLEVSENHKVTGSESFASRRYDIQTTQLMPEVIFSPRSNLTFSLASAYSAKNARTLGKAYVWKVPFETHYSQPGKLNITGRLEVTSVQLQGNTRSTGLAFFELTDGRGEGRSLLWRFNTWVQITRILRATLTYTGHSPQEAPTVHTMRMQLGATF